MKWTIMKSVPLLVIFLTFAAPSYSHEPLFGLGPRTIWRNGIGFETEVERTREELESEWVVNYEFLYGLTTDLAITVAVPQFLRKTTSAESVSGLGDIWIRGKYRFLRKDVPGGVYMVSAAGGLKLATGDSDARTALGSGSTDGFFGLAADYEGRRWLVFASGRYRLNGEGADRIRRGNVFLYDLAVGLRPIKTSYWQPDVVLMAELNGQVFGDRKVAGQRVASSGGDRLFGAIGVWLTYRNWAFKPGIQFPIYQDVPMPDREYTAVAAVEVHF
jgi:hypothetical protein